MKQSRSNFKRIGLAFFCCSLGFGLAYADNNETINPPPADLFQVPTTPTTTRPPTEQVASQTPAEPIATPIPVEPEFPYSITQYAGFFIAFHNEVLRAGKPEGLSSASAIGYSIDRSSMYIRPEIVDGAKAFAVIAASKNPEFRAGIEGIISFTGKENLIARIKQTPDSLKNLPGYDAAINSARNATNSVFTDMSSSTAKIAQSAYDIQRLRWANTAIEKKPHLDAIAAASTATIVPENIDDNIFIGQNIGETQIKDKFVLAAALLIAGDENSALSLLDIGDNRSCTYRAYLNLRMCMAATRYPYEHSFCLARHSYSEMQSCTQTAVKAN